MDELASCDKIEIYIPNDILDKTIGSFRWCVNTKTITFPETQPPPSQPPNQRSWNDAFAHTSSFPSSSLSLSPSFPRIFLVTSSCSTRTNPRYVWKGKEKWPLRFPEFRDSRVHTGLASHPKDFSPTTEGFLIKIVKLLWNSNYSQRQCSRLTVQNGSSYIYLCTIHL